MPYGLPDTPQQCISGQSARCFHAEELSVLETRISLLEAWVKTERLNLLHHAYDHNALHDPLARFPPELASEILCHAHPLPQEYKYRNGHPRCYLFHGPRIDPPTRALELAAVCKRWRDLAFSEPRLWTHVVMIRTGSAWTLPQFLVEQWVARAGALPLVFVLDWKPTEDPLNNEIIALVKFICSLSIRWRSIVFRVPSALLPVFHCDHAATLDLEHFDFRSTDYDGVGKLSFGQVTIQPKNSVHLAGILSPPTNILWTNVTELEMYGVFSGAFLNIMPHLSRVKKIDAIFIPNHTSDTFPIPTAIFDLPYLSHLRVEGVELQDVATFFSNLRACNLCVLILSRSKGELEEQAFPLQLTNVRHLLMESEETLELLSLTGFSIMPEDLISVLELLPRLDTLSLSYEHADACGISDLVLDRISSSVPTNGPDNFLPELAYFSYTGPKTFSWNAVATFMEAHNKCKCYPFSKDDKESHLRPFSEFCLKIVPKVLPDDLIDNEVLIRFMTLPGSWVLAKIDEELMEASFKQYDMPLPCPVFAHPEFRYKES